MAVQAAQLAAAALELEQRAADARGAGFYVEALLAGEAAEEVRATCGGWRGGGGHQNDMSKVKKLCLTGDNLIQLRVASQWQPNAKCTCFTLRYAEWPLAPGSAARSVRTSNA